MMNELNHINFDEWLFNYFEGKLDAAQQQQFITFVNSDPSLKESLELMDVPQVSADNVEVPKGLEQKFMKAKWYAQPLGKATIFIAAAAAVITSIFVFNSKDAVEQKLPVPTELTPTNNGSSPIEAKQEIRSEHGSEAREYHQDKIHPHSLLEKEVNKMNELNSLPKPNVKDTLAAPIDMNPKSNTANKPIVEEKLVDPVTNQTTAPKNKDKELLREHNPDELDKPLQ